MSILKQTPKQTQVQVEPTRGELHSEPRLNVPNAYGRRSAVAAEAAARWEALEGELDQLRQQLNASDAQYAVATQTIEALRREIASLRFDNERLVRENTAIQTRVNIAAETLIKIVTPTSERTSAEGEAAVASALSNVPEADAPAPGEANTEVAK